MARCLGDVGRIPLIKSIEEIELAYLAQAMKELLCIKKAVFALKQFYLIFRSGQVRDRSIAPCLRLVVILTNGFQISNLNLFGLIWSRSVRHYRVVDVFVPSLGCEFSEYFYWRVTQSIACVLYSLLLIKQLSSRMAVEHFKKRRIMLEFSHRFGRHFGRFELAHGIGIEPRGLEKFSVKSNPYSSLDDHVCDEEDYDTPWDSFPISQKMKR